jgi:hypothetical protein
MFVLFGTGCGTNMRMLSWQARTNTAVRSLGLCDQCGVTSYDQRPVISQATAAQPQLSHRPRLVLKELPQP